MEALNSNESGAIAVNQNKLKELPLFEYQVLAAATENFAVTNKLGEGGFGSVYKVCKQFICFIGTRGYSFSCAGEVTRRARDCCEEALTNLWTRTRRVCERGGCDL